MEQHYRFAGVEVTVCLPDGQSFDDRHLSPFRVEAVREPHRYTFRLVPELPAPELPLLCDQPGYRVYGDGQTQQRFVGAAGDPHMRLTHRGSSHTVLLKAASYPRGISAKTVLNALSLEHLVAGKAGFVFHCAYIEWGGRAILFTAPSGTGKSTQAELWRTHRAARIINGDRAAVRLEGEQALACGIPFAGSSVYCHNATLPLAAVVYLTQAPATAIRRLRGYEAFSRLWEGVSVNTWDSADMARVSAAVERIAAQVPVYHLACTPDKAAVLALEGVL